MYGYSKIQSLSTRGYRMESFLGEGGLAHIRTETPIPAVQWALSLFKEGFLSSRQNSSFLIWISDMGHLNPEALVSLYDFPLNQALLVKAAHSQQAWKMSLEATQSGLFQWILLCISQPCEATLLRQLQLATEKNHSRVFIFSAESLPHWMFKLYLETRAELLKDSYGKIHLLAN